MDNRQFDLDLLLIQEIASTDVEVIELKMQPCSQGALRNRRYRLKLKKRFEISLPDEARCSSCGFIKPRTEFDKNRAARNGLALHCKSCKSDEGKARSAKRVASGYVFVENKICSKCNSEQNRDAFGVCAGNRDGLHAWCKQCASAHSQGNYRKNSAQRIKAAAVYAKKNPKLTRSGRIAARCNRRAKDLNVEGRITAKEWRDVVAENNNCCFYCKRPESEDRELTADHMTPMNRCGTNYICNIAPACFRCNGSKGNRTADEFIEWRTLQV
jgi:5-methylcytosine-specific restriction endonuclease McrA